MDQERRQSKRCRGPCGRPAPRKRCQGRPGRSGRRRRRRSRPRTTESARSAPRERRRKRGASRPRHTAASLNSRRAARLRASARVSVVAMRFRALEVQMVPETARRLEQQSTLILRDPPAGSLHGAGLYGSLRRRRPMASTATGTGTPPRWPRLRYTANSSDQRRTARPLDRWGLNISYSGLTLLRRFRCPKLSPCRAS